MQAKRTHMLIVVVVVVIVEAANNFGAFWRNRISARSGYEAISILRGGFVVVMMVVCPLFVYFFKDLFSFLCVYVRALGEGERHIGLVYFLNILFVLLSLLWVCPHLHTFNNPAKSERMWFVCVLAGLF